MANEKRKKLVNIHSNVVDENGEPKEPVLTGDTALLYGEIAVNYAAGHETIFIRNSNNHIVPFKANLTEDITNMQAEIAENANVTAAALNDFNERIGDIALKLDEINGKTI